MDQASICPRQVIKKRLDIDASAVIFVHNHPSGSMGPSQPDIDVTEKLVLACRAIDIIPLDHIMMSPYGYLSLKSNDLFSKIENT